MLYNSLDPQSIPQHLAFYQLYPQADEGQNALKHVWQLLSGGKAMHKPVPFPPALENTISGIISLVNHSTGEDIPALTGEELSVLQTVAAGLPNRKLLGSRAKNEAEVLALPPQEIDLARGVFLSQLGNSAEAWQKILSYEAMLDLWLCKSWRGSPSILPHRLKFKRSISLSSMK